MNTSFMQRDNDERIPNDLIDQYTRAEKIFMARDSSFAELSAASKTIIEQSQPFYAQCCKQSLCSRILEESFQYIYIHGDKRILTSSLQSLSPFCRKLSMHNNGSHVVQTLLSLCSRIARDDQNTRIIFDAVLKILFSQDSLKELLESNHSTHVLKSLLRCESGLPPEDSTCKRNHTFYRLMCEEIYGKGDKYNLVKTGEIPNYISSVYNTISQIGVYNALLVPDTSSLVQTIVQICAEGRKAQYKTELTKENELAINEVEIVADALGLKYGGEMFKYVQQQMQSKQFLEIGKYSADIMQKFKEIRIFNRFSQYQSLQFFFESALQYETTQVFSTAMVTELCKLTFEEISKGNLLFIFQKCLKNIYSTPELLTQMLQLVCENVDNLLELNSQCVIANVLFSAHTLEYLLDRKKYMLPGEKIQQFQENVIKLLQKIITATGSSQFFVHRLLFPALGDTEKIELDSKYDTKYLNVQVDKEQVGEVEFKKLMDLKRKEHESIQQLEKEAKYGPRRHEVQRGVWKVGQQIILEYLGFHNPVYIKPLVLSFFESFISTQVKQVDQVKSDLINLLSHPGGCDVLTQFVENQAVPLHYKFLITNLLQHQFNKIIETRIGKLFLTVLSSQLVGRIQVESADYQIQKADITVNLSALTLICLELGEMGQIRYLQKSQEGANLVQTLRLELYLENRNGWKAQVLQKLGQIQRNFRQNERGRAGAEEKERGEGK